MLITGSMWNPSCVQLEIDSVILSTWNCSILEVLEVLVKIAVYSWASGTSIVNSLRPHTELLAEL